MTRVARTAPTRTGLLVLGVTAVVLSGVGMCRAGELKFVDAMQELALSDPGYAWHGYHDTIVCADFDGDGDVDVLVVTSLHEKGPLGSQGRFYVNLLRETGKLRFEDRTEKLVPGDAHKKIIADGAPVFFDVDGDLDLCVISDEHHPLTLINDKGVFRLEGWGFSAQHLTIRDFDGDGDLDVLGDDTGILYVNDGKGTYKAGKTDLEPSGHMPQDKVLPTPAGIQVDDEAKTQAAGTGHVYYSWKRLDLNGDGTEDYCLFLSQAYGFKVARFYAGGKEGYRDVTKETGLPTDAAIQFVDLSGDGRPDAVATSQKTGGVFLGDGKGHFTRAEPSDAVKVFRNTTGGVYTGVQAVVDFDCDGVPDILSSQSRVGTGAGVLRGTGKGCFDLVLRTNATSGQALADVDGDGLLDVITSDAQEKKGLHVWLNRTEGKGHWLVVRLKGPAGNPFAVNAEVEAFPAGRLGVAEARLAHGKGASDGLPVHLGLGGAVAVDLRVTFSPGVVGLVKDVGTDRVITVDGADARREMTRTR